MTPAVKRLIRELATAVIGDREDAALMRPVLMRTLKVEVDDFCRYWEPQHAKARLYDHEVLLASPIARRGKNAFRRTRAMETR